MALSFNRSRFIFRQLFEHVSSTYTYLLACAKTREAILIDPVLETVERDCLLIRQLGLTLKYAVNTHVHADHVTGSGSIKQKLPGVQSMVAARSTAKCDTPLNHGDRIKIGEAIELEARATPGHTDGCMAYVWHDAKCVFTGDALLIRGCGRTDFQQGNPARLYDSVHTQIFSLADDFLVYPAHDYKGNTCSSVGEERVHNPRLSKSKSEFGEIMNNLNLPYPKQIDKSMPANLVCGIFDLMDDETKQKVENDYKKVVGVDRVLL